MAVRRGIRRLIWIDFLYLVLAAAALWLGMSVPAYFRSVSPLVLAAAAQGTPDLQQQAQVQLEAGRPGLALPLITLAAHGGQADQAAALRAGVDALLRQQPLYRWSGGPAPFYEQFLRQAAFLREDEPAVIPTLLPGPHRQQLLGFLNQSASRNVHRILESRSLGGWQRLYPVYSTAGQPLEAAILAAALLEQSGALPDAVLQHLLLSIAGAAQGDARAQDDLEAFFIALLTIGRHADWLQLQAVVQRSAEPEQLLFAAHALQEDPARLPLLLAAVLNTDAPHALPGYLHRHGARGWQSLQTALLLGRGAVAALLERDKPVYEPPRFWHRLPAFVRDSQAVFKDFAEAFPAGGIVARAAAFGLCGFFLVGILRALVLGRPLPASRERRVLVNLDSLAGAALVTLLVWVMIEPGLLDFRPNEEGRLQLRLAQALPGDSLSTTATTVSTMIDQATILVLLLFLVVQLLIFIIGLLKIAEIRRQQLPAETKLRLLENEDNLFDLGLYVGLGGTVASLILVVLSIVDASLMTAYASTLFGILFVALLKVGFLRPYRRQLILGNN